MGSWEEAVRSLVDAPAQRGLVEACYFDLPAPQINYFPYTPDTLREGIGERFGPLKRPVATMLRYEPVFSAARRLLSLIDNRPGRLISFVCRKG